MNTYLRYLLPAYFVAYFLFLIVIRTWIFWQKTGKNPIVLSNSDDAHGLISKYFLLLVVGMGLYVGLFAFYPAGYNYFMPLGWLDVYPLKTGGMAILAISLVWTYAAQGAMHESWRVGIDNKHKTDLVTNGVFAFSRNPIYLGMLASLFWLALVTPNAFTTLMLVAGFILIQIQVRLEEDFLLKMHGQAYQQYMLKVARYI